MTYEYIIVSHISQCNGGSKGVDKLGVDQPESHRNGMQLTPRIPLAKLATAIPLALVEVSRHST